MVSLFKITILFIIYNLSDFHFSTDANTDLVGKWNLEKHIVTKNGQETDIMPERNVYYLYLFKNGTYKFLYEGSKKNVASSVGKWKYTIEKKIRYYDGKLMPPFEKAGTVSNKELKIIKLTGKVLIIEEPLFSKDIGTSHYKKIL